MVKWSELNAWETIRNQRSDFFGVDKKWKQLSGHEYHYVYTDNFLYFISSPSGNTNRNVCSLSFIVYRDHAVWNKTMYFILVFNDGIYTCILPFNFQFVFDTFFTFLKKLLLTIAFEKYIVHLHFRLYSKIRFNKCIFNCFINFIFSLPFYTYVLHMNLPLISNDWIWYLFLTIPFDN